MDPSVIPSLPPESTPGDLLRGLTLPLKALALIARTPRLLGLTVVAALVAGAALTALAVVLWPASQSLAARLVGHDATWQRVTSAGLGLLVFAGGFAVGALTLPNLVLAPLQDPLSEATEARCGGFTAPAFSVGGLVRGTLEALAHTSLRLLIMAIGLVALWPLNLLPLLGSALWVGLSSAWSMFWLAAEHLSTPMARHLRPFSQVVRVLRRRLPLALGFGAALWGLLWVPVLNALLMPIAVVAGTLLYRGLLRAGAIDAAAPAGHAPPPSGVGLP